MIKKFILLLTLLYIIVVVTSCFQSSELDNQDSECSASNPCDAGFLCENKFCVPDNTVPNKFSGKVSIMPLGDSITVGSAGSDTDVGYRRKLYLELINAGYDVDFVGGESTGTVSDFDKDHEGHGGWHADMSGSRSIENNIYAWLNQNYADIILLMIGSNDVKWEEPDVTADDLERILINIDNWEQDNSKEILVILAKIPLSTTGYSENGVESISAELRKEHILSYNEKIFDIYNNRVSQGDEIVLVDMYSALIYEGSDKDLADGTHPNQKGYDKMATVWFNELEKLLTPSEPDSCPQGSVYVNGDFEGTGDTGWNFEGNACCEYSITNVQTVARTGTHSIRAEQRCDDRLMANGHRAEIYPNSLSEYTVKVPMPSEQWYGFSVFLPEDFSTDAQDYGWFLLVAQWHGSPDKDIGEISRSPPLALGFNKKYSNDSVWQVNKRYDLKKNSTNSGHGENFVLDNIEDDLGKWTDWVFHVKWSINNDGFLQVWKNGELVVNDTGPIGFNDDKGPYFKSGIYRGEETYCPIVTYIDSFKFADERGSYDCVAPR